MSEISPPEECKHKVIISRGPRRVLVLIIADGAVIASTSSSSTHDSASWIGMSELDARLAACSVMRWYSGRYQDNLYPETLETSNILYEGVK